MATPLMSFASILASAIWLEALGEKDGDAVDLDAIAKHRDDLQPLDAFELPLHLGIKAAPDIGDEDCVLSRVSGRIEPVVVLVGMRGKAHHVLVLEGKAEQR